MNAHVPIKHFTEVEMTADGDVRIPKQVREATGLIPGARLVVGVNELGQTILMTRIQAKRVGESPEQRSARIRKAIDDLAGKHSTGQTTEEIMFELRGDRTP